MIITISGTAGSGKSTVAKLLAKKLGYKHYSMGDYQRELAKDLKVDITELGEIEKKDSSLDKKTDDFQTNLGKTEDNFVIDAWLAPYFIPNAFKVFMDADIKVRAKRITETRTAESYKDPYQALLTMKQREATNRERWLRYYGYDFLDKKNYDLVIDTSKIGIEEVVDLIYKNIKDLL